MKKKFLIFGCFLLLNNCATSSSALLGPIFTGAKTGSVYQASLSYGSNRLIKEIKEFKNKKITNNSNSFSLDNSTEDGKPIVLLAHMVDDIEVSDVLEPEPLP